MGAPTLGAKGSMAKPGTKKMGNHFARRPDPGVKYAKIVSPKPVFKISPTTNTTNSNMHPPNMDGNAILRATKTLRSNTSKIMNAKTPCKLSDVNIAPARRDLAYLSAGDDVCGVCCSNDFEY